MKIESSQLLKRTTVILIVVVVVALVGGVWVASGQGTIPEEDFTPARPVDRPPAQGATPPSGWCGEFLSGDPGAQSLTMADFPGCNGVVKAICSPGQVNNQAMDAGLTYLAFTYIGDVHDQLCFLVPDTGGEVQVGGTQ